MRRILILTSFSFLFIKGFSFINPPIINTSIIMQKANKLVVDQSILRLKGEFFHSFLIVNDSLGYLNPQGTLLLFEIKFNDSTKVTKLSIGRYHGFNFGRHLFYHDSALYSVGGSGLFNTYPGIIEFDFEGGEWYEKSIESIPINRKRVINSWVIDDELHIIYELESKENNEYSYGYIDLLEFQYHESNKFTYDFETGLQFGGIVISSNNSYSIHQYSRNSDNCFYSIYDKRKGTMLHSTFFNDKACIDGNSFVYVKGNFIFKRNSIGKVDSISIEKSKIFESIDFMKRYQKSDLDYSILSSPFFFAACIIFLLITWFVVKLIWTNSKHKTNHLYAIHQQLKEFKGKLISRKELDEILEISHLNPDSAKVSRSQRIKEVNNRGETVISRIRDFNDKRMFIYKIN
jgi:hypothetical protein